MVYVIGVIIGVKGPWYFHNPDIYYKGDKYVFFL